MFPLSDYQIIHWHLIGEEQPVAIWENWTMGHHHQHHRDLSTWMTLSPHRYYGQSTTLKRYHCL